jgi:hypothetical protein
MTDTFTQLVSTYGPRLMSEFGLTAEQAAGAWGNIGHESGGGIHLKELGKRSGGGRGLCQWTGSRRRSFEAWCHTHGVSPADLAGNYGYLIFELHGTYRGTIAALKQCRTLDSAVISFEKTFEAAGIKNYGSRCAWARRALAILHPGHPAAVEPAPRPSVRRRPVADKHRGHH